MKSIAALLLPTLAAAACSSTPSAVEVARRGPGAVVGAWTSELDASRLSLEKGGELRLERGGATILGRWRIDGDAITLEYSGESPCAGSEAAYRPEIVRDTVRFTLLRDECLWREELMAWPWRRR